MSTLDDAIHAIRMGNREEGRRLLEQMLETDENNEEIWLWLTSVVDTDEDREVCLENVLALNPQNIIARRGLEALRQGTFNINDVMSQVVEQAEVVEEPDSGRTFLEEFELSRTDLDGELVMPSTMVDGKSKKKAPKQTSGRVINVRRILLIAFVLVILCALASALAFNYLLGGDRDSQTVAPPGEPGQAAPGGGEEAAPEATATATPTDTPTPTNTPDLSLPTRRPTEPPTPTSTPVVPPTPG